MVFRSSSINLKYSIRDNLIQILVDFLSLALLIVFIYSLYLNKISVNNVLRMSIILLIIFFVRLFRKSLIHVSIHYIETLNDCSKLRI